jgi:uncharacterized membrane protein
MDEQNVPGGINRTVLGVTVMPESVAMTAGMPQYQAEYHIPTAEEMRQHAEEAKRNQMRRDHRQAVAKVMGRVAWVLTTAIIVTVWLAAVISLSRLSYIAGVCVAAAGIAGALGLGASWLHDHR